MQVRNVGGAGHVVRHRMVLPGEIVEIAPGERARLETQFPGAFEVVGRELAFESGAEPGPADGFTPEADAPTPAIPLTELNGVGQATAGKLRDAGVDDVAALTEADVEALADAASVSADALADWMIQARELLKGKA